jgi:hypothetical protein
VRCRVQQAYEVLGKVISGGQRELLVVEACKFDEVVDGKNEGTSP